VLWLRQLVQVAQRQLTRFEVKRRAQLKTVLRRLGLKAKAPPGARRGGHNRVASELENALVRLKVECPHLGLRGLAQLLARTSGVALSPSTVRAILIRRRQDISALGDVRRRLHARIVVPEKLLRWSVDLTLVWVVGVLPVWLLGVVDCHGSRLVALRPVWPTASSVARALDDIFAKAGKPKLLVTDNGGQFVAKEFRDFLAARGVKHKRIAPGCPWTNGRVERLFRTFKELHRFYAPVLLSLGHVRSVCDDFAEYYNHCRPHMSFEYRTPEEVAQGLPKQKPIRRVPLFDGQLLAFRFT
jgi:transposase InsO family protein